MKLYHKLPCCVAVTILLLSFLTGCGSSEAEDKEVELIVSAAASLTDVTAEIADNYKKVAPNVKLTFTYGSSGALQTQIEEGAPSDIFISAAVKQMDTLAEKDFIEKDSRIDLLQNKVVLIVSKDSKLNLTSFEDLVIDDVKSVALGDPSSVPVGQYSEEILTHLGILDQVKTKANYGTDVRQVLTWVESGEMECGVVYATDAVISKDVTVICEAPQGSSDPVIYPAAVLKNTTHTKEAQAFLDYLSTDESMNLFQKYGFEKVK